MAGLPRRAGDGDARAGADAGGAGFDHDLEIVQSADATGGFDAEFGSDDSAHEGDVPGGGPGLREAGGGLDEIGSSHLGENAGDGFFVVGEQRGFEDLL